MEMSVSVQEKRDFLDWLLQRYPQESHEMIWFLEELMIDDRLLDCVHFVEQISACPKGVIMTKSQTSPFTFTFFKGKVSTENVYTAYHEIHLYNHENFFVQVNFPESQRNPFYRAVLEADKLFKQQAKETTEALLNQLLHTGKISHVKEKINDALERGDYTAFMIYSSQLKKMQDVE